jgi:hypothetical protein
MPASYSASAEVNWPLVVGVVVIAGVACYVLYSVNELLNNVESATTTPLANLEGGIGSFLHTLNPANWFSSSNATSGDEDQ